MHDEAAIRQHLSVPGTRNLRVFILVHNVDAATVATVDYAQALRPESVCGIHVAFSAPRAEQVSASWHARLGAQTPLLVLEPVNGELSDSLSPLVNSELPDADHPLVILVPDRHRWTSLLRRRRRHPSRLAETFADVEGVWAVWITAR